MSHAIATNLILASGKYAPTDWVSLVIVLAIVVIVTAMAASAVAAFYWAFRSGQMTDLREGAESIFTEEEPIGRVTGLFPGQELPEESQSKPDRKR